jgi:RNA polymerase sigma factor (sigma-70 family)
MTPSDLERIYKSNFKPIYKFFYYKTQSQEIAEDLTSEAFLVFVESSKRNNDIDDPTKYLYGISKNTFMKYLKGKYNNPVVDYADLDFERYIPQFVEEIEDVPTVEERAIPYIEMLPKKQKIVAKLRLIDKNSLSDICVITGKDMNYVKTMQKRALKSLRELVERTP